jgi:aqualysin 1
MQRTTAMKFVRGMCAAGALAVSACQSPVSDQGDEPGLDESTAVAGLGAAASVKAVPGEYIVVFRDDAPAAATTSLVQTMHRAGATIQRSYSVIPGVAGKFTAAQLDALRRDPSVAYVEPNYLVSLGTIYPNPPFGLDRIDSRTGTDARFNDFGFNGAGVHIYVVDTGVRTTHREFTGRIGAGVSTLNNDPSVQDCNGHGTNVASIAAGTRFGVAKGAIVHPVRVLDCAGNGTIADVIEGLDFVLANVAAFPAVVNMSLFGGRAQALNDAVAAVTAADIPVVVAAGNFTIDACLGSPASEPTAITVGATAPGEARAGFSNFGPCLDIFAPGVGVIGGGIGNDDATLTLDGTSQAAPHVAGAVALFLQRFPRVTNANVTDGVLQNATQGIVGNPAGSPNRFLFVEFRVPQPQSCFGRCGGQSPDFSCGCDVLCDFFEDCCIDKGLFCPGL